MNYRIALASFTFLWLSSLTFAGIGDDLTKFFNTMGGSANVNQGGTYKDQSAGYYTGGSLFSRNQIRTIQPMTVQMPGFRAGCGGIDLFTGGFSHIRSGELINALRNIGASMGSYAFMLAIQTVSPQIYNILNELNALANKINQTNINSCEAAATMLGGLWPKSDQASKHLCQAMGSNLGSFSDWASARQSCGAEGRREDLLKRKMGEERYKNMLVGEFNLAWKAIQKNDFLSKDKDLAEFFLSLSGTIISRKNGDNFEIITLSSLADREELLTALLHGGNAKIYRCDGDSENRCLNPKLTEITVAETDALRQKVSKVLEIMVNKIYEDTAPAESEKAFLNSTRLPIYKILNVSTAYRKGQAPMDVHQYADLIALDILYQYISEVLDVVSDGVTQLKAVQVDDSHIKRFQGGLTLARERITERRNSAFQQMDTILSFVQKTQMIERQIHSMLGTVANEINWL
jgi:conjugative transfer pilus assembly protein TraH